MLDGVWLSTVSDPELGEVLIAQFLLRGTDQSDQPPGITFATRSGDWGGTPREDRADDHAEDDPATRTASVAIPPMRVPLGDMAESLDRDASGATA